MLLFFKTINRSINRGDDPMDTISERIKKALYLRNMKQVDLVERTGIGKSSISTYISGEYEPKQKNIYKIAKALNVNEAWLMGYDVPMERTTSIPDNDLDLSIIQRERSKMTEKEKTKLMNILKANFDDYNWEEDDSGDIE